MVNSEDLDEMQHNAAFNKGMHCWLRSKTTFRYKNTSWLLNFNDQTTQWTAQVLLYQIHQNTKG